MRTLSAVLAFALLLTACGDERGSGGREEKPPGFQGQYRGEGPAGSLELTLVETGDIVELTVQNEKAVGKRVAANRVEAETKDGELTGHIVLLLEGDDVRMKMRATSTTGESADLPDVVFHRLGAKTRSSGSAGAGARDQRLVAHWRFTESFASGGFTQATDYHLVLEADGSMERWSRSQGDAGGSDGERTRGTWKTEGGQLWVKNDGESEWGTLGKFALTDTHLMLTGGGGKRTIYERVG